MQYNPERLENHSGFLWPQCLLSSNSNFLIKIFQRLYEHLNVEAHVRKDRESFFLTKDKHSSDREKKMKFTLTSVNSAFASNFMHVFLQSTQISVWGLFYNYLLSHNFAVLAETWIFNLCFVRGSKLKFSLRCVALENHTELRVARAPLPFRPDLKVASGGLWSQPLTTSAPKGKEKEIKDIWYKKASSSERRNREDLTRGRVKTVRRKPEDRKEYLLFFLIFTSRKCWIK